MYLYSTQIILWCIWGLTDFVGELRLCVRLLLVLLSSLVAGDRSSVVHATWWSAEMKMPLENLVFFRNDMKHALSQKAQIFCQAVISLWV